MTADVELWLYGSRARGDADVLSDTDVLAVTTDRTGVDEAVRTLTFPRIHVSTYSWDEIEAMRDYGSLYLHHVAREGKLLQASTSRPGRMLTLLGDLPPFSRAEQDLGGFRCALAESVGCLSDGGWPDFECEVVATVARHAAILGAYCFGNPAFGRERPFEIVGSGLGYSSDDVAALVGPATAWRKRQPGPHESPGLTREWLVRVERFLDDLEQVIDDYASALPRAA